MYNKQKFNKINDKKVLHKIKKQWVTISLALLMMIGGGVAVTHVSASAAVDTSHTPVASIRLGHRGHQNNITTKARALHKNLLSNAGKHAFVRSHKQGIGNTSAMITVNKEPAHQINNVNKLRAYQNGVYDGQLYSRINSPFNKMQANHKIALHSSINLRHDHVYGYLYRGNTVKIYRTFKEFGRYNNYLRYEIYLNKKHNAFITGNQSLLSSVIPLKNYKYYQKKINHLIRKSHSKTTKKIRRSLIKLNKAYNFNYRRYANLYKSVYDTEQAVKHPVVVRYTHNSNRPSNIPNNISKKSNVVSSSSNSVNHMEPVISSVSQSSGTFSSSASFIITSTSSSLVSSVSTSSVSSTTSPISNSVSITSSNNVPTSSSVTSNSDIMPDIPQPSSASSVASSSDVQSDMSQLSSSSDITPSSSDNETNVTPKPDAIHQYLIPNNNNQNIMFNSDGISDVEKHNIDYRGNNLSNIYSINSTSDVPLVHIKNHQSLLGYNLDQISDSDNLSDTWIFSDELNNDKNAKATDNDYKSFNNVVENGYGTDATHKYLIPDNFNHNIVLGNIVSDGNYSDYNNSDEQAPVFARIVSTKNVFGYNFDKISDVYGANNEWVLSDELNNSPKSKNNDVQEWQNFLNTVQTHYFTPAEITQINSIKQRYNYLKQNEDSSNNIYSVRPNLPNHVVGQLNNRFKKNVTDWINFYRGLYNLTPVNDNSNYDVQAQYGADGCNALGMIDHGLDGMSKKPSNITISDWQKGINATNSSNLSGGGASDPDDISGYFDDGNNATGNNTGHRAWLLDQGLHDIGIGVNNGYGDLYVITSSDSNLTSSDEINSNSQKAFKSITFPNAGVFPYSDAVAGPWSLYVPNSDASMNNVHVSVHDDTTNVNIPVNDVEPAMDYGYYGIITYEPKNIKSNHKYTVTITGQGIPNGKYIYTTKLFNLSNNN